MKIRNVFFDWSGVVSDDLKVSYDGAMYVFRGFGVEPITLEEYQSDYRMPYMDLYFEYINGDRVEIQEKVHRLYDEALEKNNKPEAFTGMVDVIKNFNKKGLNLYVFSSHPQQELVRDVARYGLEGMFKKVYGSIVNKVDVIEETVSELSLNPEETAYIGDTTHDMDACKKAGLTFIASSWGFQPVSKLEAAGAKYVAKSAEDFEKIILNHE